MSIAGYICCTSCRTCCTTPPTNELTTILRFVVQQIHHQPTKICHIPTSWHVEMLGSGIATWQICCTTSCRIVVSSSVGDTSAAGVRVVEFGTNRLLHQFNIGRSQATSSVVRSAIDNERAQTTHTAHSPDTIVSLYSLYAFVESRGCKSRGEVGTCPPHVLTSGGNYCSCSAQRIWTAMSLHPVHCTRFAFHNASDCQSEFQKLQSRLGLCSTTNWGSLLRSQVGCMDKSPPQIIPFDDRRLLTLFTRYSSQGWVCEQLQGKIR